MTNAINPNECRCKHCHYKWISIKKAESGKEPKQCPYCKSTKWNEEPTFRPKSVRNRRHVRGRRR